MLAGCDGVPVTTARHKGCESCEVSRGRGEAQTAAQCQGQCHALIMMLGRHRRHDASAGDLTHVFIGHRSRLTTTSPPANRRPAHS